MTKTNNDGQMLGFELNGTPYFYVRNIQGDIVLILDVEGNVVAEYAYDAWGNILDYGGELARVNPITYRGYYKDWATGLYYLQSRYYCPALRRFISADVFMDTGVGILGTNVYVYCNNDPVNLWDPTGYTPQINLMPFLRHLFAGTPIFTIDDSWLNNLTALGQILNPDLEDSELFKLQLSTINGANQYARDQGWANVRIATSNEFFCDVYEIFTGEVTFTFPDGRINTRGFTTGRFANVDNKMNQIPGDSRSAFHRFAQGYRSGVERNEAYIRARNETPTGSGRYVAFALEAGRGISLTQWNFSSRGRLSWQLMFHEASASQFIFIPTRF